MAKVGEAADSGQGGPISDCARGPVSVALDGGVGSSGASIEMQNCRNGSLKCPQPIPFRDEKKYCKQPDELVDLTLLH
jgi:hypothetical protein